MLVTHGSLDPVRDAYAVTIGNFDGVHLGHQAMLERVARAAAQRGVRSCALTFEPHPREFFAPEAAPARLTSMREKLDLIARHGVDRAHVLHFDASLAAQSPQAFIDDVLVRGLQAQYLLLGRDFRFGARRAGDVALLETQGAKNGFTVETMPDVTQDGIRVSSSAVRSALQEGDFDRAGKLLGRPYQISGRVAHGEKLGRELGFPTANIHLSHRPPLAGIYVVEALREEAADGRWFPGVASVGVRPTVNAVDKPLLEVFLFDFSGDLYETHLKVRFLAKLRDEKKYPDLDTLRAAIADDARRARDYFAGVR